MQYQSNVNYGFSAIGILIAITITTTAVFMYNNMLNRIQLKHKSDALAKLSKIYSDIFIRYINAHSITQEFSAISLLDIQQLDAASIPNGLSTYNQFGQAPCFIVIKSHGKLNAVMVYTGSAASDDAVVKQAVNTLNELGAYYSDKDGISSTMGLFIRPGEAFLRSSNVCNARIANNSLVLNLSPMLQFNTSLAADISLHRIADNLTPFGDSANHNTTKTDISISDKIRDYKIYFNNKLRMNMHAASSESAFVLEHGRLLAAEIQANVPIKAGTKCSASEFGTIARQYFDYSSNYRASNVVCSYNPFICNDYCYLSMMSNQIIYHDVRGEFHCPFEAPYAINGNIAAKVAIDAWFGAGGFLQGAYWTSCSAPISSWKHDDGALCWYGNFMVSCGAADHCYKTIYLQTPAATQGPPQARFAIDVEASLTPIDVTRSINGYGNFITRVGYKVIANKDCQKICTNHALSYLFGSNFGDDKCFCFTGHGYYARAAILDVSRVQYNAATVTCSSTLMVSNE